MAAPIVKVYSTTAERLNSLPIEDGQLIFVSDLKMLYLDFNNQRLSYNVILSLETDKERIELPYPLDGYYFVEETAIMWRYNKHKWIQITEGDAPHYIYKSSESDFPTLGKDGLMYATDKAIYRWDKKVQSYDCIANKTEWERIGN